MRRGRPPGSMNRFPKTASSAFRLLDRKYGPLREKSPDELKQALAAAAKDPDPGITIAMLRMLGHFAPDSMAVAEAIGVGTGTVQRIKAEMALRA